MTKTFYIDDKPYPYTDKTEFMVEVGKGKGSYKRRYGSRGAPLHVFLMYRAINVGNGYKKRFKIGGKVI